MHFRDFRFRQFLPYLAVALLYPAYAFFASENKLLRFVDALTITGVVFIILGAVRIFSRRGDPERLRFLRNRHTPEKSFLPDEEQQPQNGMNYPLLTGLALLLTAILLTLIFYL